MQQRFIGIIITQESRQASYIPKEMDILHALLGNNLAARQSVTSANRPRMYPKSRFINRAEPTDESFIFRAIKKDRSARLVKAAQKLHASDKLQVGDVGPEGEREINPLERRN